MANPSPPAVAAIRDRVFDWSPPNDQIAAALNVPDRPNPTPQPQVPKPMDVRSLLGKISPAARGKVYGRPALLGLQVSHQAGDREAVKNWYGLALDGGDITPAEYTALIAEIDAMIPDPSWPPLVSWAQQTIGRPVDAADIAAARPGA